MADSPIPLRKWVFAIDLDLTSLKGVSSMKLHRDPGVTQKTAWFIQQRIREAFATDGGPFTEAVEADETFIGGYTPGGQGGKGKAIVARLRERRSKKVKAKVVPNRKKPSLSGLVEESVDASETVYADEARSYKGIPNPHEWVNHSAGEYVREMAHISGIEGFRSMLKRVCDGTGHKISHKHLQRSVDEFAGRHNMREMGTSEQMTHLSAGMAGKRLMYRDLIADREAV